MVGYPKVELLNVGKEGFSFKATVAVYPEVTLLLSSVYCRPLTVSQFSIVSQQIKKFQCYFQSFNIFFGTNPKYF